MWPPNSGATARARILQDRLNHVQLAHYEILYIITAYCYGASSHALDLPALPATGVGSVQPC